VAIGLAIALKRIPNEKRKITSNVRYWNVTALSFAPVVVAEIVLKEV
jgi:hypothetical protein